MFKKFIAIFFVSLLPIFCAFAQEETEMKILEGEIEAGLETMIKADFLFCKDSRCAEEKKTFIKGESFFIKDKAKEGFPFKAIISREGGAEEELILPAFFALNESGDYKFEFYSRLDNYQKVLGVRNISVDRGAPETGLQKTEQKDLEYSIEKSFLEKNLILFVIVFLLITMIVGIFFLRKEKHEE